MTNKGHKIGSWLCLPKSEFDADSIRNKLKLTGVVSDMNPSDAELVMELYEEDSEYLYVPRQAGFVPTKIINSAIDCTEHGDDRDFGAPIELRPGQIPVVEEFMQKLNTTNPYGGMVKAAAGGGKTVMGLEIVRRIAKTTMVVVHKEFFLEQWTERIQQFLPKARIGYVQQGQCDYGDEFDIIIAMVQSLASRRYRDEFYRWPGVIVPDEVHRIGAATWCPTIPKFPAKVRAGLTATPRRKDGMEAAFFWHIGPILASAERNQMKSMKPSVKKVYFKERYPMGRWMLRGGRFNFAKWVSDISMHPRRNDMIEKLLTMALANGRKVICLSDRLDQLDEFERRITEAFPVTMSADGISISKYVGGLTPDQRTEAAKASLILATYGMAAEGLDIPELDTLFFLTPKSDVEQAVGRIQRFIEDKKDPLVIDVIDENVGQAMGMAGARDRIYRALDSRFL